MHDEAPGVTPDSAAIISASDVQRGLEVRAKNQGSSEFGA